jgi:hypothetical protein
MTAAGGTMPLAACFFNSKAPHIFFFPKHVFFIIYSLEIVSGCLRFRGWGFTGGGSGALGGVGYV